MTPTQLASLAQSLKDNEAFQEAIDMTRSNALEMLAIIPASDIEAIQKNQATVRVVDDIRANLEQFIRSGTAAKAPGIV